MAKPKIKELIGEALKELNTVAQYDKEIQREKEWDAWDGFKKAVQKCLELQFSEKQLIAHINIKYCDVKGQVRGEGLHDVNV